MHALLYILAQNGQQETQPANPLVTLLPFLLIGVVFYFLLIRPQQRRQRAQREMLSAVQPGDEVVTVGGLFGVVERIDEESDSVFLQVAPGTVLKFRKSAIAQIFHEEESAEEEAGETP
jgi:preprotein translocase subunit YajC